VQAVSTAQTTNSFFVGTLVRRHYKPGQRYIQLVFETAEGLKLSLSRNIQFVKSLHIGKTYHIEGRELSIGSKYVITDPTARLVETEIPVSPAVPNIVSTPAAVAPKRSKKKLLTISFVVVAILVFIGGSAFALVAEHHQPAQAKDMAVTSTPKVKSDSTVLSNNDAESAGSTPDVASASASTTSTPATTPTPKKSTSTTTPSTTPITPAVLPASTAYCDQEVVIPFSKFQVSDPTLPDTYSEITQTGVNGSKRTCYSDNAGNNPVTTTLVAPINEITTIGTLAPVPPVQ
jgi:hypothetical protein